MNYVKLCLAVDAKVKENCAGKQFFICKHSITSVFQDKVFQFLKVI